MIVPKRIYKVSCSKACNGKKKLTQNSSDAKVSEKVISRKCSSNTYIATKAKKVFHVQSFDMMILLR